MKKIIKVGCIAIGLLLISNTFLYSDVNKTAVKSAKGYYSDSVPVLVPHSNPAVVYSIAHNGDSPYPTQYLYAKAHVYINLHVGTLSIGDSSVLIDEIVLDYDESKLIIIDKYATVSDTPGTLEGYDDGDKIIWRNIWLREIPPSDSGTMDAPTDFTAQVTALIDEIVPSGSILESTMYVTFGGMTKKTSTRSTIINGDFELAGLKIEKLMKKMNDDDSTWRNTISARIGDRLKVQINLSNIGVPVNDSYFICVPYVYDFVPKGLRYIEGSGKLTAAFPKYEIINVTLPGRGVSQIKVRNGTENKTINLEPVIRGISGGRTLLGWYLTDKRGPIQGNGTEYLTKDEIPTVLEYEVEVIEGGKFVNTVAATAVYVRWRTPAEGGYTYGLIAIPPSVVVCARATVITTQDLPCLSYTPTSYEISLREGKTKTISFDVWNDCNGILEYEISSSCRWVTIYPTSGSSQGERDTIYLEINTTGLSLGNYTCNVSINSNGGNGVLQLKVNVEYSQNEPPIANFTYSPLNPTTADNIQFTDLSTDEDGSIVAWLWKFGDGNTSTQRNPTHMYATPGTYIVNLTVTDDDGDKGYSEKQITVSQPNQPPVVEITRPRVGYLYFRDRELLKLRRDRTIIIGAINITVNASDLDGTITKVEFYIDEELKHNATGTPYYYYWDERAIGFRTIKVKAYDNNGNTTEENLDVFVIHLTPR